MYLSQEKNHFMLLLCCFTVLGHGNGDFVAVLSSLHGAEKTLLMSLPMLALLPISVAALLFIYL